jgi:hypothetical protein
MRIIIPPIHFCSEPNPAEQERGYGVTKWLARLHEVNTEGENNKKKFSTAHKLHWTFIASGETQK